MLGAMFRFAWLALGIPALLAVLTGRARPDGKLPFELPSSMTAVEAQRSDVPYDSRAPLYPFGFGRRYAVSSKGIRR